LRYSSPVINFRRTAAEKVVLHGQTIEPGDRVAIIYTSANFDPEIFPDPERFDLIRSPNPHVAFGTGPHVCLGAAVARLEIKVALQELLARTTDITDRPHRIRAGQLPARGQAPAGRARSRGLMA
jgi:cytochrome P450